MNPRSLLRSGLTRTLTPLAVIAATCLPVYAAEHITLRNGSEFDCVRRELTGDRVRLYLLPAARPGVSAQPAADDANYIEVAAASVLRVEALPDPPPPAASPSPSPGPARTTPAPPLTPAGMRQMLARAAALNNNVDVDLLASIVHAESNGNALAVSRAGAEGLMQLMPATASSLNVHNSFAPEENIGGGTAYLDQLLTRYHDDIRLAVAAYNAGPAAVDRYHGIPPYAETRAYVARVVSEFNRRKRAAGTTPPAAHANLMAAN